MKFPFQLSAPLLLALAGIASADVPKKAPLSRYTSLWTNSPFTSKPLVQAGEEEANPLDDYALIGVSPIENNGFRVTLINKKKPEDRITVDSGRAKDGFSIVGVERKPGDPLGTAVKMKSGSKTGTIKFDEKLLTLAPPKVPAAVPPGQPGQPGRPQQPQLQPGQVQQPQPQLQAGQQPANAQRQPRPRVVPPPTPQAQPATQQQNQRPQRRGN